MIVPTFAISTERPTDVAADVLVLPIFEGPKPGPGVRGVKGADLMGLYEAAGHTGKRGEALLVPNIGLKDLAAEAILLLGVGGESVAGPDACRRAIGRVAAQLAKRRNEDHQPVRKYGPA